MIDPETFELNWEGSIQPAAMDLSANAMDRLQRPGVYLCLKHYVEASRVRVYAGVTKDFRLRLREHVVATLGLTYDIADAAGRVVFQHTHRDSLFDAARQVDELSALAAAEVKRMTWYCALDDSDPYIQWPVVEAMLIQRLRTASLVGETLADGTIIDTVNEHGGPLPKTPLRLRNQGSLAVIDLLGDEIIWPLDTAA